MAGPKDRETLHSAPDSEAVSQREFDDDLSTLVNTDAYLVASEHLARGQSPVSVAPLDISAAPELTAPPERTEPDAEHTLVDVELPSAAELPFQDTRIATDVGAVPMRRSDTDELSIDDLEFLATGEHSDPRLNRALPLPAPPAKTEPVKSPFHAAHDDDEQSTAVAADPLAPLRIPMVGGRYRVIERIGVGGMGKVFKVTHAKLGKTFALKIISDRMADEDKVRDRFYREARMASSMSHPNIASVVDFGEDDSVGAFMVMELVDGEPLSDLVHREGRLSVKRASALVAQVGEALDYIHSKGIVHCDIKTENILIVDLPNKRREQQVKLLDFGLASSITSMHSNSSLTGTPHYVAPERLHGDQATPATDIYGLGILFYELITGRVPWEGTMEEILRGHLELDPTPPSQLIDTPLEPAVENLILRALAKQPEQRQKNVTAFLYELQTALEMMGYSRRSRGGRRVTAGHKPRRVGNQRDRAARALFDASRIPMALIHRDGKIAVANPAFARFIMGVAVDVEGVQVQTTQLASVWASLEDDLGRACDGTSMRRTIKVDVGSDSSRHLVMWLDPGIKEDQAIFGVHPLSV